jgi:hypothetical protein
MAHSQESNYKTVWVFSFFVFLFVSFGGAGD